MQVTGGTKQKTGPYLSRNMKSTLRSELANSPKPTVEI